MPSILVVEDELSIQRLIEFGLQQAGFEVNLVESELIQVILNILNNG